MSKPIKKIPVLAPPHKGTGRGKINSQPHIRMVRRQSNDQLLREYFNTRGIVRLRVQPGIQALNGNYYGWHDGAVTVEADSVEKGNMFVQRLRQAMIDIAKDLDLPIRANAVIG